ncbi:MAG: alpha/beta fold hydrolase [Myxococcales bacterium]|nr:alpha/beta fold hydrolase [Myxococcales bacterium]
MTRWILIALSVTACAGEAEAPDPGRAAAQTDGPAPPPPESPATPGTAPRPGPTPVSVSRSCDPPRRTDRAPRLREGIVFARPGGTPLALDLALPAGTGPHPVVLVIHGGGWSAGERTHVRDEIATLANAGWAGAALDYRLVEDGRNTSPAQVADARCAVRHLRRHATELGIDPDRIAALGYSAGGQIALMLATASDVPGLDQGCGDVSTSPRIAAAIAYFGPTDLRPEAEFSRAADRVVTRFLGTTRRRDPAAAALASPITHVDAGDAPVLLVHGTADRVVPYGQAVMMREALERAGVPVTLVTIEDGQHGFRMFGDGARVRPGTCTALAFLRAFVPAEV